jgi:hypothetical protein
VPVVVGVGHSWLQLPLVLVLDELLEGEPTLRRLGATSATGGGRTSCLKTVHGRVGGVASLTAFARAGEVPSADAVPVFSFSANAWDDRELVRAFESAVSSYKNRKEPVTPRNNGNAAAVAAITTAAGAATPSAGSIVIEEAESTKRRRGSDGVVVGNVVHVEPIQAPQPHDHRRQSKDEVIHNMLTANYWAGYWAGKYSNYE